MIIIVEGPDRVGKDTLIKHIRSNITTPKIATIHSGKPPKNVDAYKWSRSYYTNLLINVNSLFVNGWTVILNRSHLGESVYAPLYREYNGDYVFDLEKKYLPYESCYLITMVDSAGNLSSRNDGDSLETSVDQIAQTTKRFIDVHSRSVISNKLFYNVYDHEGWGDLQPMIKEFLFR